MPLRLPEDEIEFHIARLEMKPGDVLVARTVRVVPSEAASRLRAYMERALPGTKVLVIMPEIELSVVSKSEAKRLAQVGA